MISPSPAHKSLTQEVVQTVPRWQQELAEAVRSIDELCALLELDRSQLPNLITTSHFPLRVPRSFVRRMQPRDPRDPLLLQVLPLAEEEETTPGFVSDPLKEDQAMPVPGLLHKYQGRALLVATGACGVHCRYCFRRNFPYGEQTGKKHWEDAIRYLEAHAEIEEVILSGGDPLSIHDQTLGELATALAEIPHLRRLRVHSRLPIVLPSRVTSSTREWLTATRLESIVVVHANHPNEIDREVSESLKKLSREGIFVLNQAVLLRGVNDRSSVLAALSRRLFASGALPYYLSLLDRVQGTAHFEISEDEARRIQWELIESLPGYLVPKLVREVPGAGAKIPVELGLGPG